MSPVNPNTISGQMLHIYNKIMTKMFSLILFIYTVTIIFVVRIYSMFALYMFLTKNRFFTFY